MRIGYPCINRSIGCSGNRTFRLASFSGERFLTTVRSNLDCLRKILAWNVQHDILFFRITSDLIPFASHPICAVRWQEYFGEDLGRLGEYIRGSGIRISMHPDQFIVLNALDPKIIGRSIAELSYHAEVLDLMGLDATAKIQLHVGGVYGNKDESIMRFVRECDHLDPLIQRRLVVENDDRKFTAADCLGIHGQTGIPVLFDVFHHSCNNTGEGIMEMIRKTEKTWKSPDGTMMADYSSQHPEKRPGSHAERIDCEEFRRFLSVSHPCDMDIMLEIKDKEASALVAVALARSDRRFVRA